MTTFRELEAFVTVIDLGSFNAAAKALNTSQSAISRLISEFEAGFEQPLFNKERRTYKPTMTGIEVLTISKEILEKRNRLVDKLEGKHRTAPMLRIGMTELTASTWAASGVANLKRSYPDMKIEILTGHSMFLFAELRTGKLDIAVVNEITRSPDMVRFDAGHSRLGWYCHPSYHPQTISASDGSSDSDLLLPELSSCSASVISAWLSQHDIKFRNSIHATSWSTLKNLALKGMGIACLPEELVREDADKKKLIKLNLDMEEATLKFVYLIRLEEVTPIHRHLIALFQNSCKQCQLPGSD